MRSSCSIPALILVLLATPAVMAQIAPAELKPVDAIAALDRLEQELGAITDSQDDEDVEALNSLRATAGEYLASGESCAARTAPQVESLKSELAILGEPAPDEEIDIWEQRKKVSEELARLTATRSNCELLVVRAQQLIEEADIALNKISAQRMWSRGSPLLAELGYALDGLRELPGPEEIGARWHSRFDLSVRATLLIAVILATLAFLVGASIKRKFEVWAVRNKFDEGPPQLRHLLLRPPSQNAPLLMVGITLSLVTYLAASEPSQSLLVMRVALSPLLIAIGVVLIRWSTNRLSPATMIEGMIDHVPALRARMRASLITLVAGYVILGPNWLDDPPSPNLLFAYVLLNLALAGCLLSIVLIARRVSGLRPRFRIFRLLVIVCLLVSAGADLIGYYNFANYLLRAVLTSLFAAFLLWLLLWMSGSSVAAISKGGTPMAYRVRSWLGLSPSDPQSGLGLYNLAIDLGLWITFLYVVANAWDNSGNLPEYVSGAILDGIEVGTVRIVPIHILYGLVAFVGILIATGWVKQSVQRRYISQTRMDRGARDALLKITGYVGFVLATLIGLKLTGISFAGLAIVAGALSVGIGFGLQNIVNNFVSGLILLFERPIKSGDFVTVGMVEGTVKQISIRSTEIETLDRQNVIVPNSELVSQQVTNWVLHDPHGRLLIKVGVAYGSDTEKVREVLVGVANEHPQVLTDGVSAPKPKALFMGFGDSSLDFELRVWIRQIRQRFDVTSDLNFAIDKAFRENGVEIPFPQRDLHLRSWTETAQPPALRRKDD